MLAYFEQHRSQASEGLVLLPGVQEVLLALKARPQGSWDIWQGGAGAYLGRGALETAARLRSGHINGGTAILIARLKSGFGV